MKRFIANLLFTIMVMPSLGIYSCNADTTLDEDGIPTVPPPTPVSTGTVTSDGVSTSTGTATSPATERTCIRWETVEVSYECGVEKKCNKVKIMDSLTTYHYETVCTDVPKYCKTTKTICSQYSTQ